MEDNELTRDGKVPGGFNEIVLDFYPGVSARQPCAAALESLTPLCTKQVGR